MMLPVIAPLTLADLDVIMELERVCFKKDPWTRRMYIRDLTENELATYRTLRLPVDDAVGQTADSSRQEALADAPAGGDQILAYGGFWLLVDEAHIATIATRPEWRGCGLGLYLMLALLDEAVARGAGPDNRGIRGGNKAAAPEDRRLGEPGGWRGAGGARGAHHNPAWGGRNSGGAATLREVGLPGGWPAAALLPGRRRWGADDHPHLDRTGAASAPGRPARRSNPKTTRTSGASVLNRRYFDGCSVACDSPRRRRRDREELNGLGV
jgi:ribosomal-protein-alanine N-acetyltransferase